MALPWGGTLREYKKQNFKNLDSTFLEENYQMFLNSLTLSCSYRIGSALNAAAAAEIGNVIAAAEAYAALRRCTFSHALRPYELEPSGEPNTTNDFGGCSFLGSELLPCIKSAHENGWGLDCIPVCRQFYNSQKLTLAFP